MRRVAVAVLTSAATLSACGLFGGGTELKQAAVDPIVIQLQPAPEKRLTAVRIDGLDVCTSGDEQVRIVDAAFPTSSGFRVVGFSRSRAPQRDVGSGYMTEQLTRPRSTDMSPTDWFEQTCKTGKGSGTTTIKIDATWTTLPAQSDGLILTYQTGGNSEDTKTVTIPMTFSVCTPQTGCPSDPSDDE